METRTIDRIVTINVDVQNDFCPGGSLAVEQGDEVITPLNQVNEFTRLYNGTVIFTGDQHPETTPHFAKDGGTWPVHCVAGTEGAALHEDLNVEDTDVIINKGMGQTDGYSAFEGITQDGTPLEQLVTPKGNERVAVILGGLATDFCVKASVIDAATLTPRTGTIDVYVLRDAVRGVNLQPGDSEQALEAMQAAGAHIVDSIDILTNKAFTLAQ